MVIQVGTYNGGWQYQYVTPKQPYNSNYYVDSTYNDDFGNEMRWCWNGKSGGGLYTWEYVEVDLSNYTGLDQVRVRVLFMWAGWGKGADPPNLPVP